MSRFSMGAVLMATAVLASPALANSDLVKLQDNPNNWASQSGNYNANRYSKLDQVNSSNVGTLKVAWTFSTGVLRGHEGSPLVIGDVMYLHTPFPNIVFALDLNDENKIIWKYEPKQDPSVIAVMCCDTVNRGLSYADGKILLQQADTSIVALDAKNGKEIWKATNGDPKIGETSTNTFMVVRDKVIAAISGAEFGVRGHATAYDLNTGKRVWRAYSVGPDNEIMFDPDKTMSLGKPVGKDSSLKTWNVSSGRSAAAPCGAVGRTIRKPTSFTTARPILRPGTRRSVLVRTASRSTRSGRCRSSLATPTPAWRPGLTR
jgi:PQQ-dependent dehydrogenase (methanol/ethanol family)